MSRAPAGGSGDGARPGLLLRGGDTHVFVPADVARRVVHLGPITRVPGMPWPGAGIAVAEGRLVTVLLVPEAREPASGTSTIGVLCDVDGDVVALLADDVSAALSASGDGADDEVETLDVRALHGELEGALWARKARRAARREPWDH